MSPKRSWYWLIPILLGMGILIVTLQVTAASRPIVVLTVNGVIGPATDDYIESALHYAEQQHAELIVIRMDTPGGLDTSMRRIIKNIANSSIPIATYVTPTGARAASAGTYILYASHIAAMSPGTNLGAATPVSLGGISPPGGLDKDKKGKGEDKSPALENDAMKRKIINDAVAYIRGLAAVHGRNQKWAEKAVREAASLPAEEALELKVIDVMAANLGDLLKQVDKREVKVLEYPRQLHTAGAVVLEYEPDWRSRFLSVITNPNIAYILMLVGIYGLIFELANPGAIIPGTIGAISIFLALYAFQLLPINYAGMGLILLGVALMVGEAFQPSFGILGLGGTVAFVIGSIIIMDTDVPGFGIDISVIVSFTLVSVLLFIFVVGLAFKARRRPVVSGQEELVGKEGIVLDDFDKDGKVQVHSETWNAVSQTPLSKNQHVKVIGRQGLVLTVEPIAQSERETES